MRSKNFIIPIIFLVFALCMEVPLLSSVLNLQVIKGEVSVVEQGEVTKIYASDNSIITYNAFDIQAQEKIQIIQPSVDSTLVIQIDSNVPTEIKNNLSANGHVYIVNPHGIFIDKAARLEEGSFHLIGAELQTEDLIQNFNLAPSTGDIVNHGEIHSNNEVQLIGRHIVNSGTISATESIRITDTNAKDQLSILHTGHLKAKEVFLEAKEGICEIYGRIESKNSVDEQYGGSICILGQHVRLIGAYLDASGDFGGGVVNLGGEFAKKEKSFRAKRTSIDDTSIIDASAIVYGPGGEVIAESKELTSFDGEIYAKGGLKGGDGGLVVTTSQNHLGIYVGKVHIEAIAGEAGCWLLDPLEIENKAELPE